MRARNRADEGVIELSLPHSRIEPDPDIDWAWMDGKLRGSTADGPVTVSITRQSAQWSWNTYTLFAEQLDDQVWLTFDETTTRADLSTDRDAASVEVCSPWMGPAALPARALVSTATREKLSLTGDVHIPCRIFDVVSQTIRIFEQSLENVPGRSSRAPSGGLGEMTVSSVPELSAAQRRRGARNAANARAVRAQVLKRLKRDLDGNLFLLFRIGIRLLLESRCSMW